MPLLTRAVLAALLVMLLLQGFALLTKRERGPWHLWAGAFTLGIAALLALSAGLLGRNLVVVAPEVDAVLVEGRHAVAVQAWLVLYVLSGWLLLELASTLDPSPRRHRLARVALLLGAMTLALGELAPIEEAQAAGPTIHRVDLHAPALLLWGAACVLQWILVVLGLHSGSLRFWLTVLLVVGSSAVANESGSQHAVPTTQSEWELWLALGVALLPAVGLRTLVWKRWGPALERRRIVRWSLRALWLVLGVVTLGLYLGAPTLPELPRYGVALLAISGVIVLLIVLYRVVRMLTQDSSVVGRVKEAAAHPRAWAVLTSFVVALACCADAIYLKALPHPWNVALLAFALLVFVELAGEGPLTGGASSVWFAVVGEGSFARVGARALVSVMRGAAPLGAMLARPLVWIWSLPSVSGAVVKVLTAAVILVVLWELPNRHRTVVRSLDVAGLPKDEAIVGQRTAQRIAHAIGSLSAELKDSEVILPRAKDAQPTVMLAATTDVDSGLRAAVQTDTVEIGGLKIPTALLLDPIQRSLELVFGMRTVHGSLQKVGDRYHLLVSASTGETWPVRSASANDPGQVNELAERAAFDIVSSDPSWGRAGMTKDWDAFKAYRAAREGLRQAGRGGSVLVAREKAIAQLRAAVEADPAFALAHYQLGVQLQLNGEPGAAVEALRAASASDARFLRAHSARARLLVDYLQQLPPDKGVAWQSRSEEANASRSYEAAKLWYDVVAGADASTPDYDRATAYGGLCDLGIRDSASRGHTRAREDAYVRAFYYCAVAEDLYMALPRNSLPEADVNRARATVANALGVILARRARLERDTENEALRWFCNGNTAQVRNGTVEYMVPLPDRRSHAASLFERAHALDPDNAVIACNLASELRSSARADALARLEARPEMLSKVANELMQRAKASIRGSMAGGAELPNDSPAALLYRQATLEMERAIALQPENLDALNNHAYMYREWRVAVREAGATPAVDWRVAGNAERNAREAARRSERNDPAYRAQVESTLGEVLLESGRPHEAIETLGHALAGLGERANHVAWDEVRWDLAQAYLCAEEEDRVHAQLTSKPPRCGALGKKADQLLGEIRDHQRSREARLFVVDDYERFRGTCVTPAEPVGEPGGDVRFTYAGDKCRKALVTLALSAEEACIHVWGRDLDRWVPVVGAEVLTFAAPEAPTHAQYFVQRFRPVKRCGRTDEVQPISPAQSFDTDPARCRIKAVVAPHRAEPETADAR